MRIPSPSDTPIEACPYCHIDGDNLVLMIDGCYWVACMHCHASGPTVATKEEAISEWNSVASVVSAIKAE